MFCLLLCELAVHEAVNEFAECIPLLGEER